MQTINPQVQPTSDSSAATVDLAVESGKAGRDVHVREITVAYDRAGAEVLPIQNLSIFAPARSVTALVGPSGSGKSSVLSCIASLLRPRSGQIWVGGIEVTSLSGRTLDAYRRHYVGVVHQAYQLIPSLTVEENVSVPLELIGVRGKTARARARTILGSLGLEQHSQARPNTLSGGQQQRVALARALAPDPAVILADEPTAHLDGGTVGDVRSMLRSLADEGRTVIVATHDDRLLSVVDHVVSIGG